MKLLFSPSSPYSSKVRMAAHYLDLDVTDIRVDTNAGPAILVDNNPLGKIPTLLTDDGLSVFDSVAIMHYFDRLKKGRLYPSKNGKRTEAEILEALCDGICDCLLAIVYERRSREEEKVHQPWIDKQWKKAVSGLEPYQRTSAEDRQEAERRPLRACRNDRLSGTALQGPMGSRASGADRLGTASSKRNSLPIGNSSRRAETAKKPGTRPGFSRCLRQT